MNCKPFGTFWHDIKACWSHLKLIFVPGVLRMLTT